MRRSRAELMGPILAILGHVTVARAQSADRTSGDAQAHVERGLSLYEAKDYAQAAAELETAYDLKKDRDVLYALAQAKRLAGDCPTALVHYRSFLDSNPPSKQADLARKNMARCEEVKPAAVPPAAPPAQVVSPAPSSTPSPDSHASVRTPEPTEPLRAPRVAWYRDVPGDLLLGGGIVAGSVGGYFFYATGSELQSARAANRYDDAETHADRAHRDQEFAAIGAAMGGTLVVAAIVRFILRDDGTARAATGPKVGAAASGVMVSF
jgi:tetratricopeptide (TPR) repeat protein